VPKTEELIFEFLQGRRIAVAGVSRDPGSAANFVFRTLRDRGYDVSPVNPNAQQVEGTTSFPGSSMVSSLLRIRVCLPISSARLPRRGSLASGFTGHSGRGACRRKRSKSADGWTFSASSVAAQSCFLSQSTSAIDACAGGSTAVAASGPERCRSSMPTPMISFGRKSIAFLPGEDRLNALADGSDPGCTQTVARQDRVAAAPP